MILSERFGLVFIHIPKTAGSSLSTAIMKRDPQAIKRMEGLPRTKHVTALQLRGALAHYDRLFSFAVVRDPFSRFCSLYRYLRTLPKFAPHMGDVKSLEEFAELFERPSWVDTLHSSKPQSEFVTDKNGLIIVSELFRYESLDDAVAAISSRLGKRLDLPHRKMTKGGSLSLGSSLRRLLGYRGVAKVAPDVRNPTVERMLRIRYQRDYEFFGYS
jgi:Sulfotransferase family